MKDKLNAGKRAGVINGFCYLGNTFRAYGLGADADAHDWIAVFIVFTALSVAVVLVGVVYAVAKKGKTY
jgi:sugar phosphate permease